MKRKDVYQVIVKGESESDWRAAVPEDIKPLIDSQANKNVAGLKYDIIKTQIEMMLNQGDTEGATNALKAYVDKEHAGYQAPVCRFKRDLQNGGCPYMGAHSFFGAFRDAADYMYPKSFYQRGVKGMTKSPSKKHLRKLVNIKPHHVFFYRDGEKIAKPDREEGQQPVGEVKGFSYYEVINHPFSFEFRLQINPTSKMFTEILSDTDAIEKIIRQSSWHGQGACRSAGYGMWTIKQIEVVA